MMCRGLCNGPSYVWAGREGAGGGWLACSWYELNLFLFIYSTP